MDLYFAHAAYLRRKSICITYVRVHTGCIRFAKQCESTFLQSFSYRPLFNLNNKFGFHQSLLENSLFSRYSQLWICNYVYTIPAYDTTRFSLPEMNPLYLLINNCEHCEYLQNLSYFFDSPRIFRKPKSGVLRCFA